jgi:hypothetical protein
MIMCEVRRVEVAIWFCVYVEHSEFGAMWDLYLKGLTQRYDSDDEDQDTEVGCICQYICEA